MAPAYRRPDRMVLNAKRQPAGTINVSRPLMRTGACRRCDPGPDGRLGSADDGGTVTAYNLDRGLLERVAREPDDEPARQQQRVLHLGDHGDETSARRLVVAGQLHGHVEPRGRRLGTGNDFTPNALINADAVSQDRFRTRQAKLNGTINLRWGLLVVPVVRHQSGTPFARTFVQTLNHGSADHQGGTDRGQSDA